MIFMITRAIISSMDMNTLKANITIPVLQGISNNTIEASICTVPGCIPCYYPGDVVYIDFMDNDYSNPVIIGVMLSKDVQSSVNVNAQSLNISVNTKLSDDTQIGDIKYKNLYSLNETTNNVQAQIDRLNTLIENGAR